MKLKQLNYLLVIVTFGFCFEAKCQILYGKQDVVNSYFNTICEETGTANYLVSNLNYSVVPNSYHNSSRVQILRISPTGSLLATMALDSNLNFENPIVSVGNNYYMSGSYNKNLGANDIESYPVVLKYDLNFHLVKKLILDSGINQVYYGRKLIAKNNRLYVGALNFGLNSTQSATKFFKLDLNLNILDSITMPDIEMDDMCNYNQHLLVSGSNFPQSDGGIQVAELDTAFNVQSRFNLDSLTTINTYSVQNVGISLQSSLVQAGLKSYYATGYSDFNQFPMSTYYYKTVSAIIKNNDSATHTQILGRDSINTVYFKGITTTTARYNYIYSAAMHGFDPQNNLPQTNRTKMMVSKMDTAGNLTWVRYYGGDMYYEPLAICATADSGVIISGMRYDTASPAVLNACEGFVMKLNKHGGHEYVGIMDHGKINNHYHKSYPNPTHYELYFDVPFEEDIEIVFYEAHSGEALHLKNYRSRSAIDIATLPPGAYTYRIKTRAGNYYSGKFIKE